MPEALDQLLQVFNDVIAHMSKDRISSFKNGAVSGVQDGCVRNPNLGHATRRGTSKRARASGENGKRAGKKAEMSRK